MVIKKNTPLCRVLLRFEPAFAGGAQPLDFALAEAYRVLQWSVNPLFQVLAQNFLPHHGHSRVNAIYTMIIHPCPSFPLLVHLQLDANTIPSTARRRLVMEH